jgi:hypothetical protein
MPLIRRLRIGHGLPMTVRKLPAVFQPLPGSLQHKRLHRALRQLERRIAVAWGALVPGSLAFFLSDRTMACHGLANWLLA